MSRAILEVCAADLQSVEAAARAGAARVELCCALGEGGVTPSIGTMRSAIAVPGIKVNVLIRPRGGDFLYSPAEVEAMAADVAAARAEGANAVVIGALTPDGDIDEETTRRLIGEAGAMSVTFHRAFDMTRDPAAALERLVALGCDRVLTSGCAASALQGAAMLARLRQQAAGRITLLAAGGITPSNVAKLLSATGVSEVHASAKATIASAMRYRQAGVSMGAPQADEFSRSTSSEELIRQIIAQIS